MPHPKWSWIMAVLCYSALPLRAQPGDWDAVARLAPGTPISVAKHPRVGCELAKVTSTELVCNRETGGFTRTFIIRREQVEQVRLEEPGHNHIVAGALIGAVIGASILAAAAGSGASASERTGYAGLGFPAGAAFGALVGRGLHHHGAVVYRK